MVLGKPRKESWSPGETMPAETMPKPRKTWRVVLVPGARCFSKIYESATTLELNFVCLPSRIDSVYILRFLARLCSVSPCWTLVGVTIPS